MYPCYLNSHILLNIFIFSFLKSRANMEPVFVFRPSHLLLLICFLLLSQPYCSSSLSSFSSFNSSTPLCHSHQSFALLQFKHSFSIEELAVSDNYCYPKTNSWKMGTDCCGWDGVTCDTMTGHVIAVDRKSVV